MTYSKDISIYNWFVDTLREAYMNDTLEVGSPCGCGIGNCINKRYEEIHGVPVDEAAGERLKHWANVFSTNSRGALLYYGIISGASAFTIIREQGKFRQVARTQPDHIGEEILRWFPVPKQVLMDIEWAFETTVVGYSPDEIMFNRLMACIKVLDEYFEVSAVVQVKTHCNFATTSVNR